MTAILESPILVTGPVLLLGTDYEGEPREIRPASLARAQTLASELSTGEYAWLSWAIWGNDENDNGRFKCVAALDVAFIGTSDS